MTELPAPPIAADVDLRDFAFMPLEVSRLVGSELVSVPDAEVFRSNVLSWCVAWHQLPAGALPDDDATLARLLGYGRDLRTWRKVRAAGGMRHWDKASDGRLYHPLVAEKVLEAWIEKLLQRKSSAAGNAKRWNIDFDCVAIDNALNDAAAFLTKLNPLSRHLQKLIRRTAIRNPGSHPGGTKNDPGGIADTTKTHSQETETETVEGTGTGNTKKEVNPKPPVSGLPVVQPRLIDDDENDHPLDVPLALDRAPETEAVRLWNEMAGRHNLPQVQRLSPARRTKLKRRLADCGGIDGWKIALEKLAANHWMHGDNDRKWRADFDFMVTESRFNKLMEGSYDRSADNGSAAGIADAWNNVFGQEGGDEPARISNTAR